MLTALDRNCCSNCRRCSAAKKKLTDPESKTAASPTNRNLVRMECKGSREIMSPSEGLSRCYRARTMGYTLSRQALQPPRVWPPRRREPEAAGSRRASLFDRSNTPPVAPRSFGAPPVQTPGELVRPPQDRVQPPPLP